MTLFSVYIASGKKVGILVQDITIFNLALSGISQNEIKSALKELAILGLVNRKSRNKQYGYELTELGFVEADTLPHSPERSL